MAEKFFIYVGLSSPLIPAGKHGDWLIESVKMKLLIPISLVCFFSLSVAGEPGYKVVGKHEGSYAAFPNLFYVSGKPNELGLTVVDRDNVSHHDATGKEIRLSSDDCGETWVDAGTILQNPAYSSDAEVSDAKAVGWIETPKSKSGDLNASLGKEGNRLFYAKGAVSRTSSDGKKNWVQKDIELPEHVLAMNYNLASKLFTKNGVGLVAIYIKPKVGDRDNVIYLRKDRDFGEWSFVDPKYNSNFVNMGFDETALVQLPDGRILALMRPDPDDVGYLYYSLSQDQGLSWSVPIKSKMKGFPASAIVLGNRVLVFTAVRYAKPMAIKSYLLDGESFNILDEKTLATTKGERLMDFGYPIVLSCGNNIVYSYYTNDGTRDVYSVVETRPKNFFLR